MGVGESQDDHKKRVEQAMKDPEIQAIMGDPVFMNIMRSLQENPNDATAKEALKNPDVMAKFQKLVQSGVIQLGQR